MNRRLIMSGTQAQMKKATIFLASRRVKKGKESDMKTPLVSSSGEPDDDEWDLQYDLLRPDQVMIADDTNAYQFFGDSVFSAPQEDLLEGRLILEVLQKCR